jgi:hypothetical protein
VRPVADSWSYPVFIAVDSPPLYTRGRAVAVPT